MQTTSHILMIRPVNFGFNAETAINNAFQVVGNDARAQEKAKQEFDTFVQVLQQNGVDVTVIDDTPNPYTPDSIFPNNWISFHDDGSIILYPMFAVNRRLERKLSVIDTIAAKFSITKTIDLSHYESEHAFLEGTGSMVLDRQNKIAYACISPRTDYFILTDFCEKMGYAIGLFDAIDQKGEPIYHTNVMMCVADKYVVICMDSIPAQIEKEEVMETIKKSGKEIITISFDQMNHFAGNMLQVNNDKGELFLVMSSQAFNSLTNEQVQKLSAYNKIIHSPLTTIETNGGGSARCMMAEVYLPPKNQ
ncbi:MAG TPA: arginine deiminase-related protein [Chitinophagaceae bacterium]|nr:arginine deiminase-related protein [Chitinophagaceae bacterium]